MTTIYQISLTEVDKKPHIFVHVLEYYKTLVRLTCATSLVTPGPYRMLEHAIYNHKQTYLAYCLVYFLGITLFRNNGIL